MNWEETKGSVAPRGDVRVVRDAEDDAVYADVHRTCAHYFPRWTGPAGDAPSFYECGPGSDLAKRLELALNVLNSFMPPGDDDHDIVKCQYQNAMSKTAHVLHKEFERHFIRHLDPDGGDISAAKIHRWLRTRRDAVRRTVVYDN